MLYHVETFYVLHGTTSQAVVR